MKILKDKRLINTIKWTVAILSFFYLVYSINKKIDQIDISFFKLKAISEQLISFVLLLFLMGLNWFIESIKWKFALKNIQKISLKTAISSVLAGISTGIFTPNRVGEFVGKIFFLEEDSREKAISVNIIASYSQLLVTILLGTFALLVASSSVLILVVVFLVVMYINITKIINWIINKFNISFLGKVEFTNKTDLGILFLFSLFRYLVFLVQFIVSLKLVGININLFVSIKSIAAYYLYLAAIPTYAWSELGVRGALAVKIFDTVTNNPLQILSASSLLWIVNIALPALIGLFFLLKEKKS
jgi:hypothetical protein